MAAKHSILLVGAAAFCALVMVPAVEADELTLDKSAPSAHVTTSQDKYIQQESLKLDSSTDDATARVNDLEATRAEVDRRASSPVTLDVSGWVSQQVVRTR